MSKRLPPPPEGTFAPYDLVRQLGTRPLPAYVVKQAPAADGKTTLAVAELFPGAAKGPDGKDSDFLREARRIATVTSPNLPRVRDVVPRGEDVVVTTEFVDGEKLAELWGEHGMPLEIALRIVLDVLSGVGAIHNLRDAKQQPMKLSHGEISLATVVMGLDGTARILHAIARRAPSVMHDPASARTMAPEVLEGKPYDAHADIYSAGVLLWEALSGGPLFPERGSPGAAPRGSLADIPKASVPAKAPWAKDLVDVAARALRPSPLDRWPSAAAMAAEVRKAAGLKLATVSSTAAYVRSVMADSAKARRLALESGGRVETTARPAASRIHVPTLAPSFAPVPAPAFSPAPSSASAVVVPPRALQAITPPPWSAPKVPDASDVPISVDLEPMPPSRPAVPSEPPPETEVMRRDQLPVPPPDAGDPVPAFAFSPSFAPSPAAAPYMVELEAESLVEAPASLPPPAPAAVVQPFAPSAPVPPPLRSASPAARHSPPPPVAFASAPPGISSAPPTGKPRSAEETVSLAPLRARRRRTAVVVGAVCGLGVLVLGLALSSKWIKTSAAHASSSAAAAAQPANATRPVTPPPAATPPPSPSPSTIVATRASISPAESAPAPAHAAAVAAPATKVHTPAKGGATAPRPAAPHPKPAGPKKPKPAYDPNSL